MNGLQSEVVLIVFIVLCAALLVQFIYYIFIYSKLAFYRSTSNGQSSNHPVSVIISARNESKNLRTNLKDVLEQDYDNFEVVLVNDCSWDDSGVFLEEIQNQYKHLRVVTLKEQEKYKHGKKFAVALGVKAAANDILLFTDADCKPAGKQWISTMQKNFVKNREIVLGYGAYNKLPGFLNKLIRFDTFFIALQYLSSALLKKPYMGVGRNLAYQKSLFFKSKGFAGYNHILSGDDDLFISENATADNTGITINPASFTYSKPKESLNEWLRQKRRHLTTGVYYKQRDKRFLSLYWITVFFFYACLLTLLIAGFNWKVLLATYLFRLLLQGVIFEASMKKLNERDLIFLYPILELLLLFINPILLIWNRLNPKHSWR